MMRILRLCAILGCLMLVLALCLSVDNTSIECTEITVQDARIPKALSGTRIAQVSDLHDACFGEGNEPLLDVLREAKPDIIVLTGDMIDANRGDLENTLTFARGAVQIAPTYYVSGNNDAVDYIYFTICDELQKVGVNILEDRAVDLEFQGETLRLIGLSDPACFDLFEPYGTDKRVRIMKQRLQELLSDDCCIVLSHRPELISYHGVNVYEGATLVFSGHIHGGQVRLPLLGGLFSPTHGLFPRYDAGLYRRGDTNMIVSRGLGNSTIQLRVNNPPEVVLAILEGA